MLNVNRLGITTTHVITSVWLSMVTWNLNLYAFLPTPFVDQQIDANCGVSSEYCSSGILLHRSELNAPFNSIRIQRHQNCHCWR